MQLMLSSTALKVVGFEFRGRSVCNMDPFFASFPLFGYSGGKLQSLECFSVRHNTNTATLQVESGGDLLSQDHQHKLIDFIESCPSLKTLKLYQVDFKPDTVRCLAKFIDDGRIQDLELLNCVLDYQCAAILAQHLYVTPNKFRRLYIDGPVSNRRIGTAGFQLLLESCKYNTGIDHDVKMNFLQQYNNNCHSPAWEEMNSLHMVTKQRSFEAVTLWMLLVKVGMSLYEESNTSASSSSYIAPTPSQASQASFADTGLRTDSPPWWDTRLNTASSRIDLSGTPDFDIYNAVTMGARIQSKKRAFRQVDTASNTGAAVQDQNPDNDADYSDSDDAAAACSTQSDLSCTRAKVPHTTTPATTSTPPQTGTTSSQSKNQN